MSQEDIRSTVVSSKSTCSTATTNLKSSLKGPTARELIQMLTSFLQIEKEEGRAEHEKLVLCWCIHGGGGMSRVCCLG